MGFKKLHETSKKPAGSTNSAIKQKTKRTEDETRKKARRIETWSGYNYKVLRTINGDLGISRKAMLIMNNFVDDMFERLTHEISILMTKNKRKTISEDDVQCAVRLLLPGELAVHAVSEGNKAVNLYNISVIKQKNDR